MMHILLTGYSEKERTQLVSCLETVFPSAKLFYGDDRVLVNGLLQKYPIDVLVTPAMAWDRSFFDVPQGTRLPQLVVSTSPRARGIDQLGAYGLHVLAEPFTTQRVRTAVEGALLPGSPRVRDWDFLLFKYNFRFVVLPFCEIRGVEETPPYTTIRSKGAVFVMTKSLLDVLSKIPCATDFKVSVGGPVDDWNSN